MLCCKVNELCWRTVPIAQTAVLNRHTVDGWDCFELEQPVETSVMALYMTADLKLRNVMLQIDVPAIGLASSTPNSVLAAIPGPSC